MRSAALFGFLEGEERLERVGHWRGAPSDRRIPQFKRLLEKAGKDTELRTGAKECVSE